MDSIAEMQLHKIGTGSDPHQEKKLATFAAGPFWDVEDAFRKAPGVLATRVGYTGGQHENPTKDDVESGLSGHAEAVQVVYDPAATSYEQLLDIFWSIHDPTQRKRQESEVGTPSCRSAIFVHDAEQEQAAKKSKETREQSGRYAEPTVTQIIPASRFYQAEEQFQRYQEEMPVPPPIGNQEIPLVNTTAS